MLELVGLFREQGTVDELGIGTIRDALADTLFPGTSTLHTRPRYLLFIPWIYQRIERDRVPSARVDDRLKRDELRLIEALDAGGENLGVIGIQARKSLRRFPSIVYWNALATLGIRRFAGSQQQYHRALDSLYRRRSEAIPTDEGEAAAIHTWHPRLPDPPPGLLEQVRFDLRREDADYLQERILESSPSTYLAHLVAAEDGELDGAFPWDSLMAFTAPEEVRDHLEHARNFSELLHGAMLLYNLILADKVNEARRAGADVAVESDRTFHYRERLEGWSATVRARRDAYRAWSRPAFWDLVTRRDVRVPLPARIFVEAWVELAIERAEAVADDATARALVAEREIAVKRQLARVANPRALELWRGAAGSDQLSFRWNESRQLADDVLAGLKED